MAELKTRPNDQTVSEFLAGISDPNRRQDCQELLRIMKRVTRKKPKMWNHGIVGFGTYHYKYESGREGDWFLAGFSPRKRDLTLYIMAGFSNYEALMAKLGKFKTGKSCLYIKKLEEIDTKVLEKLIRASVEHISEIYV